MSKARVIVLSVVQQGLTKAQAAKEFDVSWQWVHTLVTRYEDGGLDALEPRSRRPKTSSRSTPPPIRERILALRTWLDSQGLDSGPITIAWHLEHEGLTAPAISTIYDATIKATPNGHPLSAHYRVRHDIVDQFGKLTLRHAGELHHLGVGRDHARKPVLILTDETTVTITNHGTGEILGNYLIDPNKNYWRNQTKEPGRWPGSS